MRVYLIVVLICISLVISDDEHFINIPIGHFFICILLGEEGDLLLRFNQMLLVPCMYWMIIAALFIKPRTRLLHIDWETGLKIMSYKDSKILFCYKRNPNKQTKTKTGWVPETSNRDRTFHHCPLYYHQRDSASVNTSSHAYGGGAEIKYSYLLPTSIFNCLKLKYN